MANYSQQDFTSTYEELVSIVESSTTKWHPSTSTEADAGVVILKALAFLEDKSNYRFDLSLNQAYLDGVSDRQSAFELLKELGYLMKSARAATGRISLMYTTSDDWSSKTEVEIPIFTQFTDSANNLKFFATESLTITKPTDTAGWNKSYWLNVEAGEPQPIVKEGNSYFTLKDIDEQGRLFLGKSELAQNGVFVLTRGTYIDDEGVEQEILVKDWTYLDYAILKPDGLWYMVQTAESGEMYIQFPDNFSSLLADRQIVVYATYTDGSASNIPAYTISKFVDDATYRQYFSIVQNSAFFTGQDAESIDQAIAHYYETKDVCSSLVTAADFVAAIKNLVVSATFADSSNLAEGQNYLSNAIVRTAADRKTKVKTLSYGTEYQLFVPDTSEPSNQVDVLAMSPLATSGSSASTTDYAKSFRLLSPSNDERIKNLFVGDFNEQLQNNAAADVELNIVNSDATTLEKQRFLAVTTPSVTIRVSNYFTTAEAINLRAQVQNYFYSTYQAKNLTPGKKLDVQKIIEDIKALSPAIISVSLDNLDYTIYSKYSEVDGEDVPLSDTITSSDSIESAILARSVLQGSVPLWKYTNRYNTKSKQPYVYATSSGQQAVSSSEQVIPVPINATSFNQYNSGNPDNPTVVATLPNVNPLNNTYYYPLFYPNQIVQFRKPATVAKQSYGFGMTYTFDRLLSASSSGLVDAVLTPGTQVKKDSEIQVVTGAYQLPASSFTPTTSGGYTIYTAYKDVTLEGNTIDSCQAKLISGSKIAPGSHLGTTYVYDAPRVITAGMEYTLVEEEKLTIKKSSTGDTVATLTAGDIIQPAGVDLSATNSNNSNTFLTNQSVSVLAEDKAEFLAQQYKYFLSLTSSGNLTLDSNGYELKENELFVISDRAVTEYVTFGPGTVISAEAGTTLTNNTLVSLADVMQDMFQLLSTTVSAQSYDFVTYSEDHVVSANTTGILGESDWTDISSSVVTVYPYSNLASQSDLGTIVRGLDNNLAVPYSYPWQYRRLFSLVSDSTGLAVICNGDSDGMRHLEFTLGGNAVVTGDNYGYVSATTPFSYISGSDDSSSNLFSASTSARVSYGNFSIYGTATGLTGVTVNRTSFDRVDIVFSNDASGSGNLVTVSCPKITDATNYYLFAMFNDSIPSEGIIQYNSTNLEFSAGVAKIQFTISSGISTSFTFSIPNDNDNDASKFANRVLTIYGFSAIAGYASELGVSNTDLDAANFDSIVANLDTTNRFDYSGYPTEDFSYPLDANSFFVSTHPANKQTFPYIAWKPEEIKIISGGR